MRSLVPTSLVCALASALALALVVSCTQSQTPAPSGSTAPRAARERPGRSAAPSSAAAALDLQAMLPPVPEYEGTGRNLFAFGPERRTVANTPPPPPLEPSPSVAPPSRPALTPRPSPLPTRLDVKYAGFLEKTRPDGAKAKYAIFLDGNEILAGAEGETVADRFTVVEIGLESVTVAAKGTNATQRIPLQSN